jgi:hypothetical protein
MNTVLARSPPTEGPTSGPAHAVDALAVGMGVYGWAHRETPNSKSNSGRRTTANVGMRKQRTLCPTGLLVMAIVTTSSYEKSLFPNGKTWSVAFEILEKKETVPRSLFHISPICSLLWGEKRVDLTVIQRSSDIVLGLLRKQQPLMSAGTIPFVVAAGGVHFCKANEESMIDLLLSILNIQSKDDLPLTWHGTVLAVNAAPSSAIKFTITQKPKSRKLPRKHHRLLVVLQSHSM